VTGDVIFKALANLPAKGPLAFKGEVAEGLVYVLGDEDTGPHELADLRGVLAVRHQFAYCSTNL
jgi:hypothetical protein